MSHYNSYSTAIKSQLEESDGVALLMLWMPGWPVAVTAPVSVFMLIYNYNLNFVF